MNGLFCFVPENKNGFDIQFKNSSSHQQIPQILLIYCKENIRLKAKFIFAVNMYLEYKE